ncbi:MAG: ABC transporter permease [Fretibacterium sp.]|nr:ABC transporter permease [Fretibacterium sp.]
MTASPGLRSRLAPQLPITAVLLLLWGFFVLTAPATFLSRYIYVSFMTTIPFVAIVAMGMTLVVVAGEMDLSFASNMAMSGFLFAVVTRATGSPLAGIAAGLAVGAGIGLINGLVVVGTGVPSIVVTIGFDFLWRGCVMLLSGGLAVALPFVRGLPVASLFVGRAGGTVPAQFLWAVGLAVVTAVILHRTAWGDTLRFIGDNREAARMMGLPVARARVGVFAVLGLMSAFSGILACLELANWWPTQGEGYLLLVFASVFIGGTSVYGGSGSLWGTMAGTAVIGMIEAGVVSAGWSGFWTRFVHGLVLVFSVSFYALAARRRRTRGVDVR